MYGLHQGNQKYSAIWCTTISLDVYIKILLRCKIYILIHNNYIIQNKIEIAIV